MKESRRGVEDSLNRLSALSFALPILVLGNEQAFSMCSNGIQEEDITEINISQTSDLRVHEEQTYVFIGDGRRISFHSNTRFGIEDDLGFSVSCRGFKGANIRSLPEHCGIQIFVAGNKTSCDCTRLGCKDYSGR